MLTRITLVLGAFAAAALPTAALADQAPRLNVRARILQADGGPGSSTSSPHPMIIGEGVTSYLFAADSLCGVGGAETTAQNLESMLRRKMHVWKVTRTGVSHADGKLTFDLEWMRLDGGSGVPAASGKQRLTLAEGATYPVDMVRAATPGGCNAASVVVEVEAATIEAPAFADAILTYDVWLTHEDGAGKKTTHHLIVSGKQGSATTFEFTPVRFDIPPMVANQYDLDLVTRVRGTVRGRRQENGKVSLELETSRVVRLERADEPRHPNLPMQGRKVLEMTPGETVEVELPKITGGGSSHVAGPDSPKISGGTRAQAGTPSPAPAIDLKNGAIVVDFREFFADDRFSILLRVRKD